MGKGEGQPGFGERKKEGGGDGSMMVNVLLPTSLTSVVWDLIPWVEPQDPDLPYLPYLTYLMPCEFFLLWSPRQVAATTSPVKFSHTGKKTENYLRQRRHRSKPKGIPQEQEMISYVH